MGDKAMDYDEPVGEIPPISEETARSIRERLSVQVWERISEAIFVENWP